MHFNNSACFIFPQVPQWKHPWWGNIVGTHCYCTRSYRTLVAPSTLDSTRTTKTHIQDSPLIITPLRKLMVFFCVIVVSIWQSKHTTGIHTKSGLPYDDVIKWKHFPRYWPFVRGIHRLPVNSPHKGQWRGVLIFFDLRLNKQLSKRSWGWWFGTPSHALWGHCNELLWKLEVQFLSKVWHQILEIWSRTTQKFPFALIQT